MNDEHGRTFIVRRSSFIVRYALFVQQERLRPQVILFGIVSLLNDSASEMIYPLLPVFLTTTLGATPVIVGLIEGTADALSSILKLAAGWISDRLPRRKDRKSVV